MAGKQIKIKSVDGEERIVSMSQAQRLMDYEKSRRLNFWKLVNHITDENGTIRTRSKEPGTEPKESGSDQEG